MPASSNYLNSPPPSFDIIVPTRDEVNNVAALVGHITAAKIRFREIIFVDASTDRTREVIRALAAHHSIRLVEQSSADAGLAAAIMLGARNSAARWLVVMDADLSHPPGQIPDLLAPLARNTADLVIGSRYVHGARTAEPSLARRTLSWIACALAYPLTGVRDSMSGFFAIERERLLALAPATSGFKLVFEIIVRGQAHLRVREIPILFAPRAWGKSKMTWRIARQFSRRWLAAVLAQFVPSRLESRARSSARN